MAPPLHKKKKQGHKWVRHDVRNKEEETECQKDVGGDRNVQNTAAEMVDSGEQFRQPGGASWREKRGEWRRTGRGLYRLKHGRRLWN